MTITTTVGARERLMATAKRLFAERGLDAVSLREIVREAGVKHATAIQYHFGDREGLVAAILASHEARVDTRRDAMLDDYEANPDSADARSIAAILVRPLARELDDVEGRHFLRIYAQVTQRPRGMFVDTGTSIWRWRGLAGPLLPPGAAELHTRYSAITFTTVELARRALEATRNDDQLFVSRIVDVVASIVQVPPSAETIRLYAEHRRRDAPTHPENQ